MKLSPAARMQRNVECWKQETGCPLATTIEDGPFAPQPDRCFIPWSQAAEDWFNAEMDLWTFGIGRHKPVGEKSAVTGWRERRPRWAAHVIRHNPVHMAPVFEFDFDASNPGWGLALTMWHALADVLWQTIRGLKTDPHKVAKRRQWA